MFDATSNHGGMLDQVIGHALVAVSGAPLPNELQGEQGVLAALEMTGNLAVFNAEQSAQKGTSVPSGIGIASGEMIAGYTGMQRSATYTCVGDTVNLAAGIEAHAKVAGRSILLDETTRNGLPPTISVERLGAVQFKGKQQVVEIFSLRNRSSGLPELGPAASGG